MTPNELEGPEVIGMLARNVPTRLIDISRTGCLLESRLQVCDGTVGELRLQVDGETFVDDVRVTRCVRQEGSGSVYLVGAEFVQTRRPGEQSIRRAVAAILRGMIEMGTDRHRAPPKPLDDQRDSHAASAATLVNSAHSTGEEVS